MGINWDGVPIKSIIEAREAGLVLVKFCRGRICILTINQQRACA